MKRKKENISSNSICQKEAKIIQFNGQMEKLISHKTRYNIIFMIAMIVEIYYRKTHLLHHRAMNAKNHE
jgi:hypothetical protein